MPPLPPLTAIGNAYVELLGPLIPGNNVWDTAKWDEAVWQGTNSWWDITMQAMHVQITWGTDDSQGAMSVPAAGSWSVITYDPDRRLDPSNHLSLLASFLRPGGLIRVRYKNEQVRLGFIDEITYDIAAQTGEIRGTDAIAAMVKARLPEGLQHDTAAPLTLRARARWILSKAQITYVTVEADPAGELDPVVGLPIDSEASAWEQIATAAYDALYGVWLDRNGVLRFRWFGDPFPTSAKIGAAVNNGMDVDTIETKVSMEGVFNHFVGRKDDFAEGWEEAKNQDSITTYGDLLVTRDRRNPNAYDWARNLLIDRAAAATQYNLGTIRPVTEAQLLELLNMPMVGRIWTAINSQGTPINVTTIVLGGSFEINTETGWSAALTTYHRTTGFHTRSKKQYRRSAATKSIEIWHPWMGDNSNKNGAQHEVRVSPHAEAGDELHKMLMQGPDIDWTGITALEKASLRLFRPYHQDADPNRRFREEGWIKVSRLTGAWDESTLWPGPADTPDGAGTLYLDSGLSEWVEIGILGIVEAWRSGQPNYGIKIESNWNTLNPGAEDEHFIISGRQSSQKPYIIATVQM